MKFILTIFLPILAYAASTEEGYSALFNAHEQKQWKKVIEEAQSLIQKAEGTPFADEARFYLAEAYFNEGDFEWANRILSDYLKNQASPKYFEEAIQYKFKIASLFGEGSKKHLFGMKSLPQWMPAKEDALSIYDEVISALPHHELAAQSLYSKAQLLFKEEDYRASIETFQTLIRRFPKHVLAAESYIGIGNVYLTQAQSEYPDPDYLDLAEINLRKFKTSFPSETRVALAEALFAKMQEHYAENLYEVGNFFERTKKYSAAVIYYTKIINSFPHTTTATKCRPHLETAKTKAAALEAKKNIAKK